MTGQVDLSQVVDLYDEDGIIDEIDPDNLVIEADVEEEKQDKQFKKRTLK
jgi:hypothetical protein